jgi:5-methylcytosine-specific restriction endonuclease McrA
LGGKYNQKTIRERILALFQDNVGEVVTREQIVEASIDPITGNAPENWHQRLSELRTDHGYDILSWRDRNSLKPGEYVMENSNPVRPSKIRKNIPNQVKIKVKERANYTCDWEGCGLKEGEIDKVSGATVKLQVDHIDPHSLDGSDDIENYQALCGRHQVVKKNFFSGKENVPNVLELVRNSGVKEKEEAYKFLDGYFKK